MKIMATKAPIVDGKETIPVYHKNCGGIAFYTVGKFLLGDTLKSSRVRFPDGTQPKAGEAVLCVHCGLRLSGGVEYR